MLETLRVMESLGAMRVEVEGNAKVILGWMSENESAAWKYHHFKAQIRRLLLQRDVIFNWISTIGNKETVLLAKRGTELASM